MSSILLNVPTGEMRRGYGDGARRDREKKMDGNYRLNLVGRHRWPIEYITRNS